MTHSKFLSLWNLIKHSIPYLILCTFFISFIGSIFGLLCLYVLSRCVSGVSDEIIFLLENYFVFIGLHISLFAYCILFERRIIISWLHNKSGGLSGNTFRNLTYGIILGGLLNSFCVVLAIAHSDLAISYNGFNLTLIFIAIVAVFVQSSAEELLVRSYLLGSLEQQHSQIVAVVLSSAVFSALHISNNGFTLFSAVETFSYGISMCMILFASHGIWSVVGFHFMWNFSQNIIWGLPNSGLNAVGSVFTVVWSNDNKLFFDSVFGIEGTAVCFLTDILIIVGCTAFSRHIKNKHN